MSMPRGVPYLTPAEIAEIAALPALAIAKPRYNAEHDSWHAVVRYQPRRIVLASGWAVTARGYVSDPDFSCDGYAKTMLGAAEGIKRGVVEDLKGTGNRYAPHWGPYDIRYRMLPYWKRIAPAIERIMANAPSWWDFPPASWCEGPHPIGQACIGCGPTLESHVNSKWEHGT
jgi:hypothetical protein